MVNYVRVGIKPETDNLLKSCIAEFIRQDPKIRSYRPISKDFIIRQIAEYYLEH